MAHCISSHRVSLKPRPSLCKPDAKPTNGSNSCSFCVHSVKHVPFMADFFCCVFSCVWQGSTWPAAPCESFKGPSLWVQTTLHFFWADGWTEEEMISGETWKPWRLEGQCALTSDGVLLFEDQAFSSFSFTLN